MDFFAITSDSNYIPSQRFLIVFDEINCILSDEKPNNTICRPIVHYRKVMDDIVYVLIIGRGWEDVT